MTKPTFVAGLALAVALNMMGPVRAENDNAATGTQATQQAQGAEKGTRLGVLSCTVEGGFGLLLGSSRQADCTFKHADGTVEAYTGQIGRLGLDIGVSGESFMRWVVVTPVGNNPGDYALAGTYVGVSASAALGVGLGANALVGGSNKKIGLQPVSVEGKTGLNVAAGLTRMTLERAS